jgi:hypothetical protein
MCGFVAFSSIFTIALLPAAMSVFWVKVAAALLPIMMAAGLVLLVRHAVRLSLFRIAKALHQRRAQAARQGSILNEVRPILDT